MTLRLLLIVMMMSSAACAARYAASPGSTIIAPGLELAVPTGHELGYSVEATQLITAHFRDQVQVFEAYVSVSPEKFTVIALDPFGGRADRHRDRRRDSHRGGADRTRGAASREHSRRSRDRLLARAGASPRSGGHFRIVV